MEFYQQAVVLADELGMRPLAGRCRYGLGRLYRETGRRAEARSALGAGAGIFRALGMRSWLKRAEEELASLA